MRIKDKTSPLLIGLLLTIASLNVSCASQRASTQGVVATPSPLLSKAANNFPTPAGWERYTLNDRPSLSLILPGEPEYLAHDSGATERTRVHVSKNRLGIYGVAYLSDLPAAARTSTESGNEFFFNTFLKPFAMNFANDTETKGASRQPLMMEQRSIAIGDIEGIEQDFALGRLRGRTRLFRVGLVGLCVVAMWKEDAPTADQTAFFDSVRIMSGADPVVTGQE